MVVLLFYDVFSELVYGTQPKVTSGLERPCYLLHFLAAAAVQVGQQFVQSHLWHFVPSANTFLL